MQLYTLTFNNESDTLVLAVVTMTKNSNQRTSKTNEYAEFEKLLQRVISVPHSEIKAKLEAEKREKKAKRPKTSDASRASRDKD